METKGAILIVDKKGKRVKWFKTWRKEKAPDRARIEIKYLSKSGEKKVLMKKYRGWGGTVALGRCTEAIVKYWPKYDIQNHNMIMTAGHNHGKKKKVEKAKTKKSKKTKKKIAAR